MLFSALTLLAAFQPGYAVEAPAVVAAPHFQLRFGADGRPSSVSEPPSGKELLFAPHPGMGFYLLHGQDRLPLPHVFVRDDGRLVARSGDGAREVVFLVHPAEKHLALRIEQLNGIPSAEWMTLHFEMVAETSVRVTELDYMTTVDNRPDGVWVDWNYLSHRSAQDPLGGFAIYIKKDDADEDDTLLHIWVEENLPHPMITGEWTLPKARAWMDRWQKLFADRSQLILEGSSLHDLYAAMPYARKAKISEIYLFTNTWRTDAFWPETDINWGVNRKVFPRGEEDLRAFSDYVRARGIRLNLHYVSGGIGPKDPVYVGSKPDRRLASWGGGHLAAPVGPADSAIVFRPDAGVDLPQGRYEDFFAVDLVRIQDEIVRVGSFEKTSGDTWTLKGCTRGLFLTKAAAHPDGAEAAGLITPYGQNFVPDNDSTLLDEIAAGYAGLINRCHIMHTEYDGAEIHTYNGRWGYLKFATLVYQKLDHPVTAHDSSGRAPRPYFEYRLNSTQRLMQGSNPSTDGNWSATVEPASNSRVASNLLDANYTLSQGNLGGALGISKPEPMFGVSVQTLKAHGLTDEFIQTLLDWKAISHLLTDAQRSRINASFSPPTSHMPEHHWHPVSPVVWVARKEPGGYTVVPVQVLTRPKGDIEWQQGQEHGPVSPRQYIQPNQAITLDNPNPLRPLKFILRVLWAYESGTPGPAAALSAATPIDIATATTSGQAANTAGIGNITPQPPAASLRDTRSTAVTQEGGALRLTEENTGDGEHWEMNHLPTWDTHLDLSSHRCIGLDVTGDSSGAILLVQIPGRDYVVPIDFTGRRHITIPNGEVAWASGEWGWRMATKSANYADVRWMKIGFGYLPPHAESSVLVENLQALAEIPTTLQNPVIHVGDGTLLVQGSVASNQYLVYDGGGTATVYDENWHTLKVLPVTARNYIMPAGLCPVSVTTGQPGPLPWLETQFMTEGEGMMVKGRG